jgi:hypothetical protein
MLSSFSVSSRIPLPYSLTSHPPGELDWLGSTPRIELIPLTILGINLIARVT